MNGLHFVLAAALAASPPTSEPSEPTVAKTTPVLLRLLEPLSSAVMVKGDTFRLVAVDSVEVGGNLIPAGTEVVGEITLARRKGAFGLAGRLEGRLLYARVGEDYVRLTGNIAARGDDQTAGALLSSLAIGGLAFVITGKNAEIPAGTEVIGLVEE